MKPILILFFSLISPKTENINELLKQISCQDAGQIFKVKKTSSTNIGHILEGKKKLNCKLLTKIKFKNCSLNLGLFLHEINQIDCKNILVCYNASTGTRHIQWNSSMQTELSEKWASLEVFFFIKLGVERVKNNKAKNENEMFVPILSSLI